MKPRRGAPCPWTSLLPPPRTLCSWNKTSGHSDGWEAKSCVLVLSELNWCVSVMGSALVGYAGPLSIMFLDSDSLDYFLEVLRRTLIPFHCCNFPHLHYSSPHLQILLGHLAPAPKYLSSFLKFLKRGQSFLCTAKAQALCANIL